MTLNSAKELIWRSAILFGKVFPCCFRRVLCHLLFAIEANNGTAGLKELVSYDRTLKWQIDQSAITYEGGIHPKHRLMNYHKFFTNRVHLDEHVLDIGCGYGAVAHSISKSGAVVLGIDIDKTLIEKAKKRINKNNVKFVHGDITKLLPEGLFSVIVMSNVLEHLENRHSLLVALVKKYCPRVLLIRVPMINRHWLVSLKKELDLPYFGDSTHCIEYTVESFKKEIESAGLKITNQQIVWGEIWAEVVKNA